MKFLVCYKGPDTCRQVLKEALAHAKVWNADLEVVKAVTRELPLKRSQILEMETELENNVRAQLQDSSAICNVQLLVTAQEIEEKLISFADEAEVNLIFIGIVKKSKVGKLLFGSTAQHVILYAPCPVVTVKT